MTSPRKNGYFELRFNDDGSQALATIYPPSKDGEAVEFTEVMQRLKSMGVSYGIREQAVLDAVRQAAVNCQVATNVIVAQGVLPKPGQDAKVRYTHSPELLMTPLRKRKDGSGMIDWFAIDPARMVKADEELATIVPSQPGESGKTLTWPIQPIPPRPGKPAALSAGQNVRTSDDGLRLYADQDGAVALNGEQLLVHAFRQVRESVANGVFNFPAGAVFFADVCSAQVQTGSFLAIQGRAVNTYLRAHGDVLLAFAQDCRIVATGSIYVMQGLYNCDVTTPGKVVALGGAAIAGGTVRGKMGVEAGVLGAESMPQTVLEAGFDSFSAVRFQEIQEELAQCQANIDRISQALKPFTTLSVQSGLTTEKRALLNKLQAQRRTQELCIKELHNERRQITITSKERVAACISASQLVYPGVWLRLGDAEMLVETPLQAARFLEAKGGKSVRMEAFQAAA